MPAWIYDINWQTVAAVLAALTALASAYLGPRTAYKTARLAADRAAYVTARKEWIENFRNELGEYLGLTSRMSLFFTKTGLVDSIEYSNELANSIHVIQAKLLLGLDLTVPIHLSVSNLITSLHVELSQLLASQALADYTALRQRLLDEGRKLVQYELAQLSGRTDLITPIYRPKQRTPPEIPIVIE